MAYSIKSVFGSLVTLSEEVWLDHIRAHHPETQLEDLEITLMDPDQVQLSQIRADVELFYRLKSSATLERPRYWIVAVKCLPEGRFVSTAMTKSKIVGVKLIYSKSARDV